MHTGPIVAADHVNRLAGKTKDDRMALALTVMSVALVATMLVKEFRGLFEEPGHKGRGRD